ncbi:hypothetical protein ES703_17980 [subsurface metagenome]
MRELIDTEILKEIGFLEPVKQLLREKNQKIKFVKLYQAFIELCQEYNELGKKYRKLGKQVKQAINIEAYPVALPYKWGEKSNNQRRS